MKFSYLSSLYPHDISHEEDETIYEYSLHVSYVSRSLWEQDGKGYIMFVSKHTAYLLSPQDTVKHLWLAVGLPRVDISPLVLGSVNRLSPHFLFKRFLSRGRSHGLERMKNRAQERFLMRRTGDM